MVPIHPDTHICRPPPTPDLEGAVLSWRCRCDRRWQLEYFRTADGARFLGASWILES